MEEENRSQSGDIEVAGDAAPTHEATQQDLPEPHIDEIEHDGDAANTSLMSEDRSLDPDMVDTVEGDGSTENTAADFSELSHDDLSEALQDISYAEDSIYEEEANDQGEEEAPSGHEGSILPSIESDAENEAHEISVLDDSLLEDDRSSHIGTPRGTSLRTEALIQQAARDIVARLGSPNSERQQYEEGDESVLSSHRDVSEDQQELSELSLMGGQVEAVPGERQVPNTADEGGDSSSQHGTDEDVFSDNSARNSMGSYDGGSESGKGTAIGDDTSVSGRTPRISNISQYDYKDEDFIPTIRGTSRRRPPFRTPEDVRAMQMSSPPPSTRGSVIGSSRSSKRHFPTVSRLGSPTPSVQYSPKNRTPSRFKVKEAPLVLLHVTLLPLRWMWGDVINTFEASEMSEEAKTLRESWRMLQDRMGDTVFERGILLGHPQNDYELLEERLLEALDLPLRRRARILECGHYLGPANETTIGDDSESEDDYEMDRPVAKRHWCKTCKSEIYYDSLGPGKIFRVKVYASNGLMRAGAWDACWKEMERVDIELEPVIEPGVNEELARLVILQEEREAAADRQIELAANIIQHVGDQVDEQLDRSFDQRPDLVHAQLEIAPARPEPLPDRESLGEERHLRDECRPREICGSTPIPQIEPRQPDASTHQLHADSFVQLPSPSSPSEEAYERLQARRQSLQSASFFELLMQSVRVLMKDTRNIFIIGLSLLVLLMALRSSQQSQMMDTMLFENKSAPQVQQAADMIETPVDAREKVSVVDDTVNYSANTQSTSTQSIVAQESVAPTSASPVQKPSMTTSLVQELQQHNTIVPEVVHSVSQETMTQKTTVKVVETVTETATLRIETITETETMKVKATVTMTETSETSEPTSDLGLWGYPGDATETSPVSEPTSDLELWVHSKEMTEVDEMPATNDMTAYAKMPEIDVGMWFDESMLLEADMPSVGGVPEIGAGVRVDDSMLLEAN
ncbi:hypothetical protein TruAng_004315 [Truncatella angustata]|nr:hypothetical protein TruAng_004315 [Truncatella angustata]